MKKITLVIILLTLLVSKGNAQECITGNYCSNFGTNYPTGTFSTSSSSWTTVSSFMNGSNWTLFTVTAGNTYEWTYCNTYTGVSTAWDAQLSLFEYNTPPNANPLCYSDDNCGTTNAPYISYTPALSGTVLVLTSQYNCVNNTGSPYNKLVWRQSASGGSCANLTPYQPSGWDNKIVLSTVSGTNTSASTFCDNQIIYIDWATENNGTCNISQTFYTDLYVDGLYQNTYTTNGLNTGFYASLSDLTIGPLAAGSHTFQIVVDANGDVSETNEGDNSYSRTITITSCNSICNQASVTTAFNGARTIYTDLYQSNNYRLKDNCQTAAIRIRDWNSITSVPNAVEITSSSNSWTTQDQRFGGSVLWVAKQAYNYFLNVHSRQSYDNSNGNLEGYVNTYFDDGSGGYYTDNATMSFTGGIMQVGLGSSGTLTNSWCPLDVIFHEYAHAVTGSSAALNYQNESGALNESFSDIFGEVGENYILGSNDWLLGADRTSGAIRSMSNPNAYGHPETYFTSPDWYTGSGDNGGVHINSGVQNYWFYLLSQGGSGTNDNGYSYSVTGLGIIKARAIAYRNLTVYLTSTSDYNSAYLGSINAAADLYGSGSAEVSSVIAPPCVLPDGLSHARFHAR